MQRDYSLPRVEINSPPGEFISTGDEIVSPPGDFVLEYSLRGGESILKQILRGRICIEIESPGETSRGETLSRDTGYLFTLWRQAGAKRPHFNRSSACFLTIVDHLRAVALHLQRPTDAFDPVQP